MRKLMTLLSCFSIIGNVLAQDPRVYTESDAKGNVKIMAEKKKPGTITIEVNFSELSGYRLSGSNPLVQTINSPVNNIGSLTRESNGFNFNYRYSYKSYPGKNMSKADTLFPYLMPVKASNPVVTSGSYYIGEVVGKKSDNFYAIGFNFPVDDTVFATRAGTITVASGAESERGDHELYNVKARGNINIEHEDGTLARYNFIHPIKTLIEPGDFVVPGQPIAVFSGTQNSNTLLFSVSYLDLKFTDANGSHYKAIRPRFYIDASQTDILLPGKNYTSVHPFEIITKELSSKQKKKLGLSSKQ
jgi:hypothetical protein